MCPTLKQKNAVKEVVENRGNVSKAMLKAGYQPKTAKNPKNLTESKGWQELMDQHLPDKDLAKYHKELLGKREKSIVEYRAKEAGGKNIYEVLDQPDTLAVSRGLDMAYKLKGKYPKEGQNIGEIIIKVQNYGERNNDSIPISTKKLSA